MITRTLQRLIVLGAACLLVIGTIAALAASNLVPLTRFGMRTLGLDANALKPAACAALNLTVVLVCPAGGGQCDGTNANELIIGSPYADNISGGKGDDCILGGGGNDALRGDQNEDVCIGGPGTDSFHPSCETQIQ